MISQFSSLFGFTLISGLLCVNGYGYINDVSSNYSSSYVQSGVFFIILYIISNIISIPFSYYNTFVIEEEFGFNKTTKKTFFLDIIKSIIITLIIGSILLFPSIYLFETIKSGFWIWLWSGVSALMIFINMFYADLIVPIFNKLTPLEDGDLRKKIEAYSSKVGYLLKNVYVLDGSKRSTKANAFFSGL